VDQLSPTTCLLEHLTNVQACALVAPTTANSAWMNAFTLAAAGAHVPLIDVSKLMCANGRCPPVVNRVLVRFDTLHVTGAFANYTASALGDLLVDYLPATHPR